LKRNESRQNMITVVGKRKTMYIPQAHGVARGSAGTSVELIPMVGACGLNSRDSESLPATARPTPPLQQPGKGESQRPSASTLVLATPSKPRPFGRSHTLAQVTRVIPPTPIQEEPANFVADTPQSGSKRRRMSDIITPAKRPSFLAKWPPAASKPPNWHTKSEEDCLGQLMVETDDEDDGAGSGGHLAHLVAETPRKG
jgi:hypothetical protein